MPVRVVRQLMGPGTPVDPYWDEYDTYNELVRQDRVPYGGLRPQQGDMFDFTLMNSGAPGMLVPGNIQFGQLPVVKNPNGTVSTVRSIGVGLDGTEWVLPTLAPNGQAWTPREAVYKFGQSGMHLGGFDTPDNATAYARWLSSEFLPNMLRNRINTKRTQPRTDFINPAPATSRPQGVVDLINVLTQG